MAKTVTPSVEMTDGQINKATELYRAMLWKHRGELGSETVQQVLGQPEFVGEMFGVLRKRVEAVSDMIVRHVRVAWSRTPQQMLDATGRKRYTDRSVVDAMPKGEGEEANVFFIPLKRYTSDDGVEEILASYGLKRADPYSLGAVNEDDPVFADEHPNCTHWKDANGKWCYVAFDRWHDERFVDVYRYGHGWDDGWWFAGVRK